MQHQVRVAQHVERKARHNVDLAANARRSDGSNVSVRLSNISYDGCQLITSQVLRVGEKLLLELPGLGDLGAEVRWATQEKAGAQWLLDKPLLAEKP